MPTTPRKARILLKEEKAQVVRRAPFTIQLLYATGEAKKSIVLGIDTGYSIIGFSAVSEQKELLAGELILRKDVSEKITERKMYRRNRRGKLWYRKPRFLNRISSKKKGWLAPSIQHKLDSHIRLVEILKQSLPITKTIVEVASFDTQKLQNSTIKSIEYQQGSLFGYTVRNYLLEKWSHECVYCKKRNIQLEIEHIIPKSRGGTDRIDNLTISCRLCNLKKSNKLASECPPKLKKTIAKIQQQAKKSYKAATFMTIMRKQLVERLNCRHTYGDHTKYNRTKIGLSKSHVNDAFVIAGGKKHPRSQLFYVKQIRRNNRSIQTNRKRFKPSIRKQRYSYQPNDLVSYNNCLYRVKGVFNYGKWI
ncbi:MAG: RNA-guided endonuclease IscB, partial [Candidatus Hodarchaeales archaeon]